MVNGLSHLLNSMYGIERRECVELPKAACIHNYGNNIITLWSEVIIISGNDA